MDEAVIEPQFSSRIRSVQKKEDKWFIEVRGARVFRWADPLPFRHPLHNNHGTFHKEKRKCDNKKECNKKSVEPR